MRDLGLPELIVIFVIALLVFGPGRVPDLGRSLGRALREFREAIRGDAAPAHREIRPRGRGAEAPRGATGTGPRP